MVFFPSDVDAEAGPERQEPKRSYLELIAGHREEVGLWLIERVPELVSLPGGYEALGVARDGVLVGGALFTNYRPCRGGGNIEVSCAGHGWLSRRIIGLILGYPFEQLGCHRLTAFTKKSNKPSRRLLEGLGFQLEGVSRQGFGPRGGSATIYGLLRDQCRFPLIRG